MQTLSYLAFDELILYPTSLLEGHFQSVLSTRPEDNPDKHFTEGYLESCLPVPSKAHLGKTPKIHRQVLGEMSDRGQIFHSRCLSPHARSQLLCVPAQHITHYGD